MPLGEKMMQGLLVSNSLTEFFSNVLIEFYLEPPLKEKTFVVGFYIWNL